MTFDEMVQEVFDLTNRPDLIAETKASVRAATLKAHQSDFFSKDIWESGIEFGTSSFRQSWDYMNTWSNFRSFKYIKIVDDKNDDLGQPIEIVTPEETLDTYNRNRTNIAYIAGRVIEIRASVSFQNALVGAYVFPVVTGDDFESWITQMHPYAIIREAARVIFKTIGYDEQSAQYNGLVAEEYQLLKMTGLSDVGY